MTSQRRPDELIRILRTDFAGSPGSPGGGGGGAANDIFCQVMGGYNNTTSAPTYPGAVDLSQPTIALTATEYIVGRGSFGIAVAGTITVTPIVQFASGWGVNRNIRVSGNYQVYSGSTFGLTGSASTGNMTIAVPADIGASRIWFVTNLAQTFAVDVNGVVFMHMSGLRDNVADNFPGPLNLVGWKIE